MREFDARSTLDLWKKSDASIRLLLHQVSTHFVRPSPFKDSGCILVLTYKNARRVLDIVQNSYDEAIKFAHRFHLETGVSQVNLVGEDILVRIHWDEAKRMWMVD